MSVSLAVTGSRRIGIFGGAFDPPHAAHVALAQAAVANLQLDTLIVIPTGQAWHKPTQLSPAQHRLAMAQLAFGALPNVLVDPREAMRPGPSYTIDTLRELTLQWPDAQWYLIMGEDQARALPSWREHLEILQLAIICVAERTGLTDHKVPFIAPKTQETRFLRLQMPAMPVSATEIRIRVAARQDVVPLVFESVARYIDEHHLYQTT
jgi:nicotinate-nucleotide adenylyltransferase